MNISKYYPVEYENYDKALQIEFNEEVEEFKASVLLTNLLEWMHIFKNKKRIKDVIEFITKKCPDMTLNTIQIDINSEDYFFEGNMEESLVSYILDYKERIIDIDSEFRQIYESNDLSNYKFYQYGSLPILFIAARNYRIPLPSNIIYKFLEENSEIEKNKYRR